MLQLHASLVRSRSAGHNLKKSQNYVAHCSVPKKNFEALIDPEHEWSQKSCLTDFLREACVHELWCKSDVTSHWWFPPGSDIARSAPSVEQVRPKLKTTCPSHWLALTLSIRILFLLVDKLEYTSILYYLRFRITMSTIGSWIYWESNFERISI